MNKRLEYTFSALMLVGALILALGFEISGFVVYLVSNILGSIYFIKSKQYALLGTQATFIVINIIGIIVRL